MDLKEYLTEYKALTLDIMEHVNVDGNIKFLLDERENILNEIIKSNFKKSDIESIGKSLNLMGLEEEMQEMIKKEKINIKKKMQQLRKNEQGNKLYLSVGYSHYNQSIFDKKY